MLDAIKIISLTQSLYDKSNNEVIEVNMSLKKYLQKSYHQIISHVIFTQHNALSELKHIPDFNSATVIYPGCATDIIRCMLITNAKTIFGFDMVDSYFYPGLEQESAFVSEDTKNVTELVHIVKQMTYDLQIIQNVYPDSLNKDKLFDMVDIRHNKLIIKFKLFDIPRSVIVYTGIDVNSIDIKHFAPLFEKSNILFLSGFTPNIRFLNTVNPKYIIAPIHEFATNEFTTNKIKIINTFDVEFLYHDIKFIYSLLRILNTIDDTNPMIIEKAYLLCDIIGTQKFEIIQYL
jgi:hypothetical protein